MPYTTKETTSEILIKVTEEFRQLILVMKSCKMHANTTGSLYENVERRTISNNTKAFNRMTINSLERKIENIKRAEKIIEKRKFNITYQEETQYYNNITCTARDTLKEIENLRKAIQRIKENYEINGYKIKEKRDNFIIEYIENNKDEVIEIKKDLELIAYYIYKLEEIIYAYPNVMEILKIESDMKEKLKKAEEIVEELENVKVRRIKIDIKESLEEAKEKAEEKLKIANIIYRIAQSVFILCPIALLIPWVGDNISINNENTGIFEYIVKRVFIMTPIVMVLISIGKNYNFQKKKMEYYTNKIITASQIEVIKNELDSKSDKNILSISTIDRVTTDYNDYTGEKTEIQSSENYLWNLVKNIENRKETNEKIKMDNHTFVPTVENSVMQEGDRGVEMPSRTVHKHFIQIFTWGISRIGGEDKIETGKEYKINIPKIIEEELKEASGGKEYDVYIRVSENYNPIRNIKTAYIILKERNTNNILTCGKRMIKDKEEKDALEENERWD